MLFECQRAPSIHPYESPPAPRSACRVRNTGSAPRQHGAAKGEERSTTRGRRCACNRASLYQALGLTNARRQLVGRDEGSRLQLQTLAPFEVVKLPRGGRFPNGEAASLALYHWHAGGR